jgi:DNA-binding NarL/FixJ family response regulator
MESTKIVKGTLCECDFALQPLAAVVADTLKMALEEKGIAHCYTEEVKTLSVDNLSRREIQIMLLACDELPNKEIAARLYISERTVETHRKNIFRKTGVNCLAGLVKYAIRNGYYSVHKKAA